MRKTGILLFVVLLVGVDFCSSKPPIVKTVCQLLEDSAKYNGRTVRITARVSSDWEYDLDVWDANCKERVLTLTDPDDSGLPTNPNFALKKDAQYDLFEKLISAKRYSPAVDKPGAIDMHDDPTLATPLYDVQATITGRFESGDVKDKNGKIIHVKTFGRLNNYHARLVVLSFENVIGLPREPQASAPDKKP